MQATDKKTEGEAEVLAAIAAMSEPDRTTAKTARYCHEKRSGVHPQNLVWHARYTTGNKIVCWFRSRQKFGERYMTLGFNDVANLDEGNLWPISYALMKLTPSDEAKIRELVRRAAG